MTLCYFNDAFINESEVGFNINNRSYRYGDSVFETIQVKNGIIQNLDLHFARLQNSLNILQITLGKSIDEICKIILTLSKQSTGIARLQVSRNSDSLGYLPLNADRALLVIQFTELTTKPSPKTNIIGISSYVRQFSKSLPIYSKTGSSLQFVMAKIEAEKLGYIDCIMLNEDGFVCECSSFNIFWQSGKITYTPSLQCGIVNGITRQVFIKNNKVVEGTFTIDDVKKASKVFITNVYYGIVDVKVNFNR